MNLIVWGAALILIGLLLTFSNIFGFVAGAPLVTIGFILIGLGIVVAIAHFVMGRRGTSEVGHRRTY